MLDQTGYGVFGHSGTFGEWDRYDRAEEREKEARGYYFISIFSIYVDVCSILRPRQARYFTARTCEMGPARTEPAGRNAHKYINK